MSVFALEIASGDSNGIDLDGVLEKDEWNQSTEFDLEYELMPSRNTPAALRTTAYMKFDKKLYQGLKKITVSAGIEILKIYKKPFKKTIKADKSPITEADIVANNLICAGLERLTPNIPIISEENDIRPKNLDLFWLVDPLDGTKEFIKKNGEFTVNIALIKNKKPVYGIIFKPTSKDLYYTEGKRSFYSKLDKNYNETKRTK